MPRTLLHALRGTLFVGCTAAACLAWSVSAHAARVIVGPPDVSDSPEVFGESASEAATFVNGRLPVGRVRSPVTGTITRWRVNVYGVSSGTPSGFRLQVVRRTRNKPGFARDLFEAVRQTPAQTLGLGGNAFDASMRIREGNFIGLRYPADSVSIGALDGGRFLDFVPPLVPGAPGAKLIGDRGSERHLLLNATVRH